MIADLAPYFVALTVLIGTVFGILYGHRGKPQTAETIAQENILADTTHTPASPGIEKSTTALDVAQYAVQQALKASEEAGKANRRVTVLEEKLETLEHAYGALYDWADWIDSDWEDLRLHKKAPKKPAAARHPDDLHKQKDQP